MSVWEKGIASLNRQIALFEQLHQEEILMKSLDLPDVLVRKRGRPPGAKKESGEKSMSLSNVLISIGQNLGKSIILDELSEQVREAGYITHSKNLSSMVYQSITKLVKTGVFRKNEDRSYEYIAK